MWFDLTIIYDIIKSHHLFKMLGTFANINLRFQKAYLSCRYEMPSWVVWRTRPNVSVLFIFLSEKHLLLKRRSNSLLKPHFGTCHV